MTKSFNLKRTNWQEVPNDEALKKMLTNHVELLRKSQEDMLRRKTTDCQCGGVSLCAFHAQIYNHIGEAIYRLQHAIEAIDKE